MPYVSLPVSAALGGSVGAADCAAASASRRFADRGEGGCVRVVSPPVSAAFGDSLGAANCAAASASRRFADRRRSRGKGACVCVVSPPVDGEPDAIARSVARAAAAESSDSSIGNRA